MGARFAKFCARRANYTNIGAIVQNIDQIGAHLDKDFGISNFIVGTFQKQV